MEFSPFRLLVYAITAVLFLYLFSLYLSPFFSPLGSPIEEMRAALQIAEAREGRMHAQTLSFSEGDAISASVLDTGSRSVSFHCVGEERCCSEGNITEHCAAVVTPRSISFRENTGIPSHFRCELEHNLYDCKVFLDRAPAQLFLVSQEIPEEANVSLGVPEATLRVGNEGNLPALDVQVSVRIYALSDSGERELVAPVQEEGVELLPVGDIVSFTLPLPVTENGLYDVAWLVTGQEAGVVAATSRLSVIGSSHESDCQIGVADRPQLQNGQCITRYRCTGCTFSSECKLAWESAGEAGLTFKDPGYAIREYPPENGECH